MKFRFMDEQRTYHSVERMAVTLGVSRAGYYAWRSREGSNRERETGELVEQIRKIQKRVKFRYGSPRITRELGRNGVRVGHNRVARLMRENELSRHVRKRFRSTTNSNHDLPVAENLLNREFTVGRQIGCGYPTSPTSQPPRDGCICAWSSTCTHEKSSVGQ